MDDVIFAGTTRRPALGRAEVTLTIDNSNGLLPIEFNEITVSRTLFRTGESEYAINGVNCRLLDVQELLSDAGVGRQQHVIVSQGQIDAVLNARPEDRRTIIEEAAGVLKFRRRREKAARRLDATDASLLRVQDLLREVRRQLRPLERQAEAARRHGDVVAELRVLQLFLTGREIGTLRARLTAFAGERAQVTQREGELRAELARLDTEVFAAEAELTARGDTDLGDEMVRVEQLRERARGIAAVLVERRRSMERDRGQLMDSGVVASLEAESTRIREQIVAVDDEAEALGPQAEQLAADEAAFAEQRTQATEQLQQAVTNNAASVAAEVRGELRTLQAAAQRAQAESNRRQARLDQLTAKLASIDEHTQRLVSEVEHAEETETSLVGQVEQAEAARLAAEHANAEAIAKHQHADADNGRCGARAEALKMALEGARQRAGTEHLAGIDGVLGTLLDVIEIELGWEAAVEAALGQALQAVVVASPEVGRVALESLRQADISGAVLALGGARAAPPTRPTVGEAVRDHVHSTDKGVGILLDVILANAVRVPKWSAAVDAAIDNPGLVIVTEYGDRFAASGWSVGGAAGGGATAAALEEATAQAEAAAARLAAAESAVAQAAAALAQARATEAGLLRNLDDHDASFNASSEGLAKLHTERRETAAEIDSLNLALRELVDARQGDVARQAELEALLPALEADETAEQRAAAQRGALRAALDRTASELNRRRQDLEVRSAGLDERRQMLHRRLAETEQRLQADQHARAAAATRRQALERDLEVIDRLSALVDGHRQSIEVRHNELAEIRRRQSDEVRAIAARLDAGRRSRADAERELEASREKSRRLELDEAEVRMRLEGVIEGLRRDHDVEPEVALTTEQPVMPEGVNPLGRARELERELRLMGPINPLALEEFNELQERHGFLEAQLEDVRSTRRELLRVIRAVDQEIQSVFAAAYADVSGHFTALFSMLFPGGSGKLTLTNPDDLLNTGIEVEAKPSGKNVKKLSLLSGGERSLTALAYLFAVFRSRPSPFYVMDEVEAALDDVNLHRFLGLIQEFRSDAQLLIVSHQKRTMEAGDSLLGVTMQPGGSSKVVTERVSSS